MKLWKPPTLKIPRAAGPVLEPQGVPEALFPYWDRGPGPKTYYPVLIRMKGVSGNSFTFTVFDRADENLTELPTLYTLDRHEKTDDVDSHFCDYPSTVNKWFENKVLEQVCLLFIEEDYAADPMGIPSSALFEEGKWPRGLSILQQGAVALLFEIISKNPQILATLSGSQQTLLKSLKRSVHTP